MAIFDQDDLTPPEPTEADTAHAVARSVVGAIPVFGQTSVELLQAIMAAPMTRRRQEWENDVAKAIRQLRDHHGVRIRDLGDKPAFVDAVLSATQAALRTSQVEKRAALLNAIRNSVLPGAPEVAEQQIFIGLVDRFTEWHLRILKLFQDPLGWRDLDGRPLSQASSLTGLLTRAYPELARRQELCDLIWADLKSAGLHSSGPLNVMMTSGGTMAKRTSAFGDRFLGFVSSPPDVESSQSPP